MESQRALNAESVREVTKPEGCVIGDGQCLGFPDGCAEVLYCAMDHLLKQAGLEAGFGLVEVGRVPYKGYVIGRLIDGRVPISEGEDG